MADRTCALPGCSKPCAESHLACGEVHHLLLMASRYNPSLPPPHQLILDRNASCLCALPSCSRSPWPGHAWCGRTHYLEWLSDFYSNLPFQQICKLPECTRHVFVEVTADGPRPSQFCGWRHRQKYVMRTAIELQQHQQPPSTQRRDLGHVPSVKSLMHVLKHFALYGDDPSSIKVDKDFFTKHPWEVLTEGPSCVLIAQCKFTWKRKKKQREMVTKDHYHWKQQGPPKEKNGYSRKYFTYRKLRGKNEWIVQHCDEELYTMKEYSIDASKLYCLVKLCKASYKKRKGEVNVGLSQDSVHPERDHGSRRLLHSVEDDVLADSFYEGLPSITELSYNDRP